MELACPPCPRLLRTSASFFGLSAANEDVDGRTTKAAMTPAVVSPSRRRMKASGQRHAARIEVWPQSTLQYRNDDAA
jgi:hypothetical protein